MNDLEKLSSDELRAIIFYYENPCFNHFANFILERQEVHNENLDKALIEPMQIFRREQSIGARAELRNLLPVFISNLKSILERVIQQEHE